MTKQTLENFALALGLLGTALIPSTALAQVGFASKLPGKNPATAAARMASRHAKTFGERQPGLPHISPKPAIRYSSPQFTYTWGLIDFPRSNSSTALGINDKGQIVGAYDDANLDLNVPGDNAFRLRGNTFSSLAFPGAVQTAAYGSNNSGEIIGVFVDTSGNTHGFTLVGSTYTQLDCPGGYTVPTYINKSGEIVGFCANVTTGVGAGFLLSGGVYTTIAPPEANYSWAEGINDAGVIVGWYYIDGSAGYQGFVDNGGSFTTLDYPGYPNTYLAGINNSGLIVGGYGSPVTIGSTTYEWPQGFLYSAGTFSTIDAPFGDVGVTNPFAVNNKGEIVGGYVDSGGMNYGFYLKVTQ